MDRALPAPRFLRLAVASMAIATAVASCSKAKSDAAAVDESRHVQLLTDNLLVKTGSVGSGKWEGDATYVLVDAKNSGPQDLMVTAGGELLASGEPAGKLRPQSLRIPAGGVRMFALVDDANEVRSAATAARVEIAGAFVPNYPPPVRVTDTRADMDQGRAVIQGYVENTAERKVWVIVIAAFYDADGKPLGRKSGEYAIDGHQRRGVMFVGPEGSKSALAYVGDYAY